MSVKRVDADMYLLTEHDTLLLRVPGSAIPENIGHNCDASGCPSGGMHNIAWLDLHDGNAEILAKFGGGDPLVPKWTNEELAAEVRKIARGRRVDSVAATTLLAAASLLAGEASVLRDRIVDIADNVCGIQEVAPPTRFDVCAHCGEPATCIGSYEDGIRNLGLACDDCCGHGNEDGWCRPIAELGWALRDVAADAAYKYDHVCEPPNIDADGDGE